MNTLHDCSVALWNHRLHDYAGLSDPLRVVQFISNPETHAPQFLDSSLGGAPA